MFPSFSFEKHKGKGKGKQIILYKPFPNIDESLLKEININGLFT